MLCRVIIWTIHDFHEPHFPILTYYKRNIEKTGTLMANMANMMTPRLSFLYLLENTKPKAEAWVRGGERAPELSGLVKFYETPYGGVLVEAEVFGLPNIRIPNSSNYYGMHIHEMGDCSQNFANTGGHYNPTGALHPEHAGDLPPLLGNQGYAWSAFYDKRFTIEDILGRSVVIHAMADDFHSQPAGNSGEKIGCGEIRRA